MNEIPELHDETLERSVIGLMVLHNTLIPEIATTLKAEDYFFQKNQLIHSLIVNMFQTDGVVDLNLIHNYITKHNLEQFDVLYVAGCIDPVQYSEDPKKNIEAYRKQILEYSHRRKYRVTLQNALQGSTNGIDTDSLISTHKCALDEIQKEIAGATVPLIIPADDFLKTEIPKREEIIKGVVRSGSLVMVYGFRGRGKTYFLLSMAISAATGTPFLCWDVPFPRTVLFVDGEMPEDELQQRLFELTGGQKIGNLYLLTSEHFHKMYGRYLNLNTIRDQQFFFKQIDYLEAKPEVIFLDSISTLTSGSDENLSLDQEPFMDLSRQLRHKGHCVTWAHHAGKNLDQRGASKREDILDLSINLAEPLTPAIDGAAFRLEFTKVRGRMPKPYSLECELITDESGLLTWSYSIPESRKDVMTACLQFIDEHKPKYQVDVAEALDYSKYQVHRAIEKARDKKLLDGLELTKKGSDFLSKIRGQK